MKPASRGGKDTPDNLVCASHFYNQKKGNNSRDNAYLFMKGRPTGIFFRNRHVLTPALGDMMRRHGVITAKDWYFNRAVFNVMVGVNTEWEAVPVSRQPDFWQRSALKKLHKWRKLGGLADPSFVDRGLVRHPAAPDVVLLLSLAHADSEKQVAAIHKHLLRHYRANAGAIESFVAAPSRVARERAMERAEAARWTTEPLLEVMRTNLSAMADMDGPVMSLWL